MRVHDQIPPCFDRMDSSVRLPRIFVLATCSVCAVLAVTFGLLFVRDYKRTRKKYHKDDNVDDSMKPEHENTDLDQTCLVVDPDLEKALEENGHGVFSRGALYSLLNLMRRVEDYSLEKLLTVLLNCSAFSANQVKHLLGEEGVWARDVYRKLYVHVVDAC